MKYSESFRQEVINFAENESVEKASKKFDLSIELIGRWLLLDQDKEKLERHVRQKFYSLIPAAEAKITSILSDFIVCSITDDEWDKLVSDVNLMIFNIILKVYKESLNDDFVLFYKKDNSSKNETCKKNDKKTDYDPVIYGQLELF